MCTGTAVHRHTGTPAHGYTGTPCADSEDGACGPGPGPRRVPAPEDDEDAAADQRGRVVAPPQRHVAVRRVRVLGPTHAAAPGARHGVPCYSSNEGFDCGG